MRTDWQLSDYVELTEGGRFYWLRPKSVRARLRWWTRRKA